MADLFIQDPIYLSLLDTRDSTNNEDIKSNIKITDDDLKKIIQKAEDIIDYVIGEYGVKLVEGQTRIFPVVDENIPLNIQKATILLVDRLYEGGILTGSAYNDVANGQIKSETYRGHTVSYFGGGDINAQKNYFVNTEIMGYLSSYVRSLNSNWYK